MTEVKPRTSSGCSRSGIYRSSDTEAGLLDALCLATVGEAEATIKRDRHTKLKPTTHSIEIVKQLIEFIQGL